MSKAIFGRPLHDATAGGAHIGVTVVTLYKDKMVLFERPGLVGGADVGDLWFPWDHLEYGESPDAAAKRVLKQWGRAEAKETRLAEVFSMVPPGEDWQLIFHYVAALKAPPKNGDNVRSIKIIAREQLPRMVGLLRRSDIKHYLAVADK
jgi:ADP-ribose pyrophosphatase YjhB (NUDIX family)